MNTSAQRQRPSPVTQAWLRRLIFYALLCVAWEAASRSGLWPRYLFPGPLQVFATLAAGIAKGVFLRGAFYSLKHILIGYSLSLIIGLMLGMLIGRLRLVEETLGSLVMGLQALPSVCWLPLAILWLGLNERAVVFVVVMGALFSITLGVQNGIKNTPPQFIHAARNLGARGIALYSQVILPAALPTIINGLKQGWSFAWRSLMAAELLYYSLSLGNLLQTGRDLNDAAQVMAVMLVIIFIGVMVDQAIFAPIECRLRLRWGLEA